MSLQVDPLSQYYDDEATQTPEEENDPLAAYYDNTKDPSKRLFDIHRPEEKTPEELKALSPKEKYEYAKDLRTYRELQQSSGFVKGAASGATFGATEHIPGLKPNEEDLNVGFGEIAGSSIPILGLSKIFNNPLAKLAGKSPVLQKQLTSLANLTGIRHADKLLGTGLAGGVYGATTEAVKKGEMPSTDDFINHGATWAALDAALQATGGAARFTKALVSKAKKAKVPDWKILNETIDTMRKEGVDFSNPERVQAKALSILGEEAAPQAEREVHALKDRKVEQKFFDKLEGQTVPEPYFPKQFEALETVEKAANEGIETALDELAPRAATEKQLGENIKASIDSGMKEAENVYRPAYQAAEEAASTKYTVPLNTSKLAVSTLQNLEGLVTKPEGFKQVIKTLQDAMTDAGFVIQRDKEGVIDFAVADKEARVDKLMELGRRLNNIINYDSIDKSVKDRLKPIVQSLKQDIKTALKGDKHALEMYETAEREFAKSAKKFGKDSIRKIRKMEAGEKVAKLVRNPTTLADLKEIMPEAQYKEVEREVLEHIKTLNENRARSAYRELRPYLSTDAQVVGEEILESKIPKSSPTRKEALRDKVQNTVLDDLSKASLTGQRPENALKLWKTKEGQQLIKEGLKDNPNKKEVVDYLTNQSLKDMTESIVNSEGTINFKKLNEFMKDPATLENIRLVAGEEGVNFFKNLETLANRAEKNFSIMEGKIDKGSLSERKAAEKVLTERGKGKLERFKEKELDKTKGTVLYKLDNFLNTFGYKTKAMLGLLGFAKHGIPGALETTVAFEVIKRTLQNKRVQKAIRQIAGPRRDPVYLIKAYEDLDKAFND